MCRLCINYSDYSIKSLICCSFITVIPKEFTQLTKLDCSDSEIKEIPKEFTKLTDLDCSYTKITEIPKEFTQLIRLDCSHTKITQIPKEFTQLTYLFCNNTNITEIPKEFTQLKYNKYFNFNNCPNLVKVTEKFKEDYMYIYNSLREKYNCLLFLV